MKRITTIVRAQGSHWVGDGFPVRTIFSYQSHPDALSPFLLLDYAGPHAFEPTDRPRGVGQHPHRGFETVTIVYQGEVAHRDTAGHGGVIGPGDVQWMTAGDGVLHEELHGPAFARRGGSLEMVQLWVNLPARHKRTPPAYQAISAAQIPDVPLSGDAGHVRVIAGEFNGQAGPARTFTPMQVWDVRLSAGADVSLPLPQGYNAAVVVLRGAVDINGTEVLRPAELAVLDRADTSVDLKAEGDATLLILSGEPIDEPVVGYGPFVMNTEAEIDQAIRDLRTGKFGRLHD
jgi:quercetin 2,3-dioxygenase